MEFNETNLQVIIALLTSLFIASVAIPTIVTVATKKGLVSTPNGRTSHKGNVPVLGGLALFLGVGISSAMWTKATEFPEVNGLLGAALILLAIGLKDDILVIDPFKKLIGEILAAVLVVLFADLRFSSFQGTLGIYELGYSFSIIFSIFVIVLIINAFNLIDGIDGLASGTGIVATFILGYWFFRVGELSFAVFSLATTGALIGFFYFNVLGSRNKIFMGDTGALLLGMVLSALAIKFCELNITDTSTYQMPSAPAIAIAVVGVPLFDMIRVSVLRVFRRQSPFRADKNHIHHMMLSLHFAHLEATLILLSVNVLMVLAAIALRALNIVLLIVIIFAIFMAFTMLVFTLKKRGLVVRKVPKEIGETRFGRMMTGQRMNVKTAPEASSVEDAETDKEKKHKKKKKSSKDPKSKDKKKTKEVVLPA